MVEEIPQTSIPADMPGVHLEDNILSPVIVDVKKSEVHMDIDARNGNLTDITEVHPQITGVEYTTSDVNIPVPEPLP